MATTRLSGTTARLQRSSAGLPAPTAGTVIMRVRIAAYSAGTSVLWALVNNASPDGFLIASVTNNGLRLEKDNAGGGSYAVDNVWTDSYADWVNLAWTFAAGATNYKSFYHRTGGSFTTGITLTGATFTQSILYVQLWPGTYDASMTVDYAVLKIWSAVLNTTEIQAEFASRAAVRTSNLYFYNDCTTAASVQTDGSGNSNDFTVTGTPTSQVDDPWGGGAAGAPPAMGGSRNLLTGRLPHLRMNPTEAEAADVVRASKRRQQSGRAFSFLSA